MAGDHRPRRRLPINCWSLAARRGANPNEGRGPQRDRQVLASRPAASNHFFGRLHKVTLVSKEQMFGAFNRVIEEQIDQAADHPDASGQQQMKRVLAEANLFANPERAPPMLLQESMRPRGGLLDFLQPGSHLLNLQISRCLTRRENGLPVLGGLGCRWVDLGVVYT